MMKKINNISVVGTLALCLGLTIFSCEEDNPKLGTFTTPTNLTVSAVVVGQDANNPNGDGTGVVNFTASADNAITYKYVHSSNDQVTTSGEATYNFTNLGVNTYTLTVLAYGTGGSSTSTTISVDVLATYDAPDDLKAKLYGYDSNNPTASSSKTWRIKSESIGHFGLGPVGGVIPTEWYGAGPDEKVGVGLYDDRYVFNSDGTFTHITNNTNDDPTTDVSGTVFGRVGLIDEIGTGTGNVNGADVENLEFDDYSVNWSLIAPNGVEKISLSGLGFIGYYVGGSHQYEIFDRSEPNELLLKITDGNSEFDWWFIITSADQGSSNFQTIYNNLIWEDNFDTNGAPDAANWTYDLGAGGWGNNEEQTYTNNADNVIVDNGILKITAKAQGGSYTSARIKSENLFEFTYGRVETRAKLPIGGGTWPAIWSLGANFDSVGWPNCGEIDIMEHVGNNQNIIYGTLHQPGNSGGDAIGGTTVISNASTEFHTYSVEWTPNEIIFLVDDNVYFTYDNDSTTPFNNDFFFILNVAMGGTFGGTIDSNFTESTMEVDYIRVYQ